jgi:hypothetical protein
MNIQNDTLTNLRNILATRRQAKFNKARLAVRKAKAMEDDYGYKASQAFWVEARDLYDSAARLYANPTPWDVMLVLA